MVNGPGLETLNVCAGEFTTWTSSKVPEIFILHFVNNLLVGRFNIKSWMS